MYQYLLGYFIICYTVAAAPDRRDSRVLYKIQTDASVKKLTPIIHVFEERNKLLNNIEFLLKCIGWDCHLNFLLSIVTVQNCKHCGNINIGHEKKKRIKIDQFRYIKIQPQTIDFSTTLWGINTEFVGFIPKSLVLMSSV